MEKENFHMRGTPHGTHTSYELSPAVSCWEVPLRGLNIFSVTETHQPAIQLPHTY